MPNGLRPSSTLPAGTIDWSGVSRVFSQNRRVFMLRAASSGNQPIQRDRCSASFAGAFVVMGKNRLGSKDRRRSQICQSASKVMRRDGTNAGHLLKLAHFPKLFSHSLDFLECLFPFRNRLIVLSVEPLHHAPLFIAGQLRQIIAPKALGKNLQPVESQYSPLPVTRFDQRLELALSVAKVQ